MEKLEQIARELCAATGCTMAEARAGIRLTLIKIAVADGKISLEQANERLADVGVQLRQVTTGPTLAVPWWK